MNSMEPTETPTISTGSPSANNRTTCDVLAELAKNSEPFDCVASTKEPCDQVDCATEFAGLKFTAEVHGDAALPLSSCWAHRHDKRWECSTK